MSLLRWTTKSLGPFAKALYSKGFTVSQPTVSKLLKKAGYRLQAVFKTKEGADHPDRDAQFGHINALASEVLDAGDPVISVDVKRRELAGEYANKGREWQPEGQSARGSRPSVICGRIGQLILASRVGERTAVQRPRTCW
jgi:hypothetical protein